MKLFNKEKELFVKILNGIFVVWGVAAVTIMFALIINYFLPEPKMTEEQFMNSDNCYYYMYDGIEETSDTVTSSEDELYCSNQYESYVYNYNNTRRQNLVNALIAFSNAVVVSGVIFILNRK